MIHSSLPAVPALWSWSCRAAELDLDWKKEDEGPSEGQTEFCLGLGLVTQPNAMQLPDDPPPISFYFCNLIPIDIDIFHLLVNFSQNQMQLISFFISSIIRILHYSALAQQSVACSFCLLCGFLF